MKKGQTAVEYLMTYGWAILIILIVAGVLAYYGIFSPAGFLGPSARGFAQVNILSPWDFNSAGKLTVRLENRVGSEINISNIYADTSTPMGNVVDISPDETIASGGRSEFLNATFVSLTGTTAETYSINVAIEYYLTSSPGTLFNSTGTVSGSRS